MSTSFFSPHTQYPFSHGKSRKNFKKIYFHRPIPDMTNARSMYKQRYVRKKYFFFCLRSIHNMKAFFCRFSLFFGWIWGHKLIRSNFMFWTNYLCITKLFYNNNSIEFCYLFPNFFLFQIMYGVRWGCVNHKYDKVQRQQKNEKCKWIKIEKDIFIFDICKSYFFK